MKNIKIINKTFIFVLFLSIFSFITQVNAAGSVSVGFGGNSTVAVNEDITLKLNVSNINGASGGVESLEGNLVFDNEYLDYVSGTGTTSPYRFQINVGNNYKIAGLDTYLDSGITSNTTVFTFVFKAKKVGSTQVTLSNLKVTDASNKLTANLTPKVITITDNNGNNQDSKSSDATLKSLAVTNYSLSPVFSQNTTNYTVNVPIDATSVNITGSANNSKATVSGLGNISLNGITTSAKVTVTAENGSTKTYTINIVKNNSNGKDSDATLKSLDVSGYTLTPTFRKNVNTYSMRVTNNITALKVNAVANSSKAKVQISGNSNWKEGVNVISIKVTAEDGTVNTYNVNVTRMSKNSNTNTTSKSNDNSLSTLTINSSHEINPTFNKDVTSYNVIVPNSINKLDLSYVTNNPKATVKVIGNSDFIDDKVNTVIIEVTAEDGSQRNYVLNVTRSTSDSENNLEKLVVKDGELNPKFDSKVLEYTVNVPSDTNKLDITAVPENKDSKVEINGNENLKEGHNNILIKVTDKNGFTKYYMIDAIKEKSNSAISKISFTQSEIIGGILVLLLLLILLLLILLLSRKRKEKIKQEEKPTQPIIEVKPEFNFGSKNKSDDDTVYGNLNQDSDVRGNDMLRREIGMGNSKTIEAQYEEIEDLMPYNPYDETVTKRELIDAINEATKTKDPTKLEMLLKQDELNQKKKEMKKQEELKNHHNYYDDEKDEWR